MSRHYSDIVALAKQRHRPQAIAQRLNLHPQTVYADIRKARMVGVKIPHFLDNESEEEPARLDVVSLDPQFVVPLRLKTLLVREAERAGKSPTDLAREILEKGLLDRVTRHG
ncbi:MAG: HTH domain-containing protein [Pseudomonadota bacterium]